MTASRLTDEQADNQKKVPLNSEYKALESRTDEKFKAWMMTVEERWLDEIEACIQGKFPDWRE